MHQILAYIKFLWHSKNEHGVHSPFVYSLLTECLYKKERKPAHHQVLEYRQALLNDDREIKVTDFGAGSRVFKSDKRKISAIAKNAGISKKRAVLLNKLVSYLEIKTALELGTSVGISSAAIAAGNEVHLTTIEGCPETAKVAGEYFERFGLDNIRLEVGSFEQILSGEWTEDRGQRTEMSGERKVESGKSEWKNSGERKEESGKCERGEAPQPLNGEHNNLQTKTTSEARKITTNTKHQTPNNKREQSEQTTNTSEASPHPTTYNLQPTTDNPQPITRVDYPLSSLHSPLIIQPTTDLVYFDGNHQKEATLKYFHQLLPLAHNDSVFIFDDIHWSQGMEEAWEEIKQHPRVRVSIDSFFWGMVFFRKEQEKEHFIIRL